MPVDPRILAALERPMTGPTDLRFASKRGYVSPPGTGPAGETCRTCRNARPVDCNSRVWFCDMVPDSRADRGAEISLATKSCGRWQRLAQ